jgi:IS605 OrfB family transposase
MSDHRVARLRRDGLHKLTTALAGAAGTIVAEDLNVAGMLRNRHPARAIADAGFGEIRRQLTYKTSWRGGRLVLADRWYPSSKTCSDCGTVKPQLPLHVRGVPLRQLRPGHRPGRQLRTQSRRPRDGSRYRSGRRPGRASAERTWSRP